MPKKDTSTLPDKYMFRREQILHHIILAGEIPADFYKELKITYTNFHSVISTLTKNKLITTNRSNNLQGYILSTQGRKTIETSSKYTRYAGLTIGRTANLQKRTRMRMFAAANAMFDKLNVIYEPYLKPKLTSNVQNLLKTAAVPYFYSALEFKEALESKGVTIKGSKSYGILLSRDSIIPLYFTKYDVQKYNSVEFKYKLMLNLFFNREIKEAIIFCDGIHDCATISKRYIFESEGIGGKDITGSGYYKSVYIIPRNYHIDLLMWTINNEETVKEQVINQYLIKKKNSFLVNDGFTQDDLPVIFALNINISRLRLFLNYTALRGGVIVCYDIMLPLLKEIAGDNKKIKYISVKSENIERRL